MVVAVHAVAQSKSEYEVYAIRYAVIPDFPVASLVAGADRARKLDIAMMVWLVRGNGRNILVDSGFYHVFKGDKSQLTLEGKAEEEVWTPAPHMANFLKAVRSRKPEDLTAPVEVGVQSATLCHLANISYRRGRKLEWDSGAGRFAGDAEASALLTRRYRAPYIVPEKV